MLVTLRDLRVKPGCLFQCKFFTAFFLNKVKMLYVVREGSYALTRCCKSDTLKRRIG